jgi:hypothetical protein
MEVCDEGGFRVLLGFLALLDFSFRGFVGFFLACFIFSFYSLRVGFVIFWECSILQ